MSSVISHQIKAGERWDTLAYHYYGDVAEISRLIDANPHLPFCEVLPVGQTLLVPVMAIKCQVRPDNKRRKTQKNLQNREKMVG